MYFDTYWFNPDPVFVLFLGVKRYRLYFVSIEFELFYFVIYVYFCFARRSRAASSGHLSGNESFVSENTGRAHLYYFVFPIKTFVETENLESCKLERFTGSGVFPF